MSTTLTYAFALDASKGMSFGASSSAVALPGTPASDTVVRVANLGPCHLAVAFGNSAVTVASNTGCMILAGQTEFLALPSGATYIAGISCGGQSSTTTVNVSTGN